MEFAYVLWKQKHPQHDWFGNSAIACFDLFEPQSCCNFLPVQRIIKKCAFCVPKLEIVSNVQCLFLVLYRILCKMTYFCGTFYVYVTYLYILLSKTLFSLA